MHLPSAQENRFNLLVQMGAALQQFPDLPLSHALSAGQIHSKRWLVKALEDLDLPLGTVFVLGGWWGILPAMLFESRVRLDKIRSFDIDPDCAGVADTINRPYVIDDWRFKATTADMLEIDYRLYRYATLRANGSPVSTEDAPDTVINTCCEHLSRFPDWWEAIPSGKLAVLQSNNFKDAPDHVNCVNSLDEFARSAPMAKILFRGELDLPDYKRFMLVGEK